LIKIWQISANKAIHYLENNNLELAKVLFYQTIEHGPDKAWPYVKYADIIEDIDFKIDLYSKSINLEPTEYAYIGLIQCYIVKDDLKNAKFCFSQLIQLSPDNQYISKYSILNEINYNNNSFTSNLLPKKFNINFYIEYHPELSFVSKLQAIFHYIEHGQYEKRDICPQKDPKIRTRSHQDKIILFTQYFKSKLRFNDFIKCLDSNLENPLINKIIIFHQCKNIDQELTSYINDIKIEFVKINKRLSYKIWFDYSNQYYPNDIKILANSDIYFDKSLEILKKLTWANNMLYACSRKDINGDNQLIPSKICAHQNFNLINPLYSQDCWIFKTKLIDFESRFVLGYENCDVLLKHNCQNSGCEFINLYKYLNAIHVDNRAKKIRPVYDLHTSKKLTWQHLAKKGVETSDETQKKILLQQAVKLKPDQSWPYIKLADLITKNFRYKFKLLIKAISIDNNLWSYVLLVNLLLDKNFKNKARFYFNKLKKLNKASGNKDISYQIELINTKFKTQKLKITYFLKKKHILFIKNKLECVCLLLSYQELDSIYYNNIIEYIQQNTKKTDIHFKILINNNSNLISHKTIDILKTIFLDVEIIDLQLSSNEDIYLKESSVTHNIDLPKLGFKHGPNTVFFEAVKRLSKYNTTLLLESDCILSKNWLEAIVTYVDNSNGFLISGAVYDGMINMEKNMRNHINGGTSLIATGNKNFQQLMKFLYYWMTQQIEKDNYLAYDYALKQMILENVDNINLSKTEKIIWNFINRNYVSNNLTFNVSTKSDSIIDPIYMKQLYNFAILHTKNEHLYLL
jgi:hypothetical protein